jgi:hypothetical protein
VFTSLATTEYAGRLDDALTAVGVDETRLGSASALCAKEYPLDPQNLAGSYLEQLDAAVREFCADDPVLLTVLNEVFEQTYRTVFDTEPAGEFPGPLQPKEWRPIVTIDQYALAFGNSPEWFDGCVFSGDPSRS